MLTFFALWPFGDDDFPEQRLHERTQRMPLAFCEARREALLDLMHGARDLAARDQRLGEMLVLLQSKQASPHEMK